MLAIDGVDPRRWATEIGFVSPSPTKAGWQRSRGGERPSVPRYLLEAQLVTLANGFVWCAAAVAAAWRERGRGLLGSHGRVASFGEFRRKACLGLGIEISPRLRCNMCAGEKNACSRSGVIAMD